MDSDSHDGAHCYQQHDILIYHQCIAISMTTAIERAMEILLTEYGLTETQVNAFICSSITKDIERTVNLNTSPMKAVRQYLVSLDKSPYDTLRDLYKFSSEITWNGIFPETPRVIETNYSMYSDEGNQAVDNMMDAIEEFIEAQMEEVAEQHPEIYDTAVREILYETVEDRNLFG